MGWNPGTGGSSGGGGGGTTLAPTATKTGAYNAAASDLVICDISAGSFTVTLPTAPADKTQVGVSVAKEAAFASGQFSATFVTIACGGSDVLLVSGGAASAIFGTGTIVLQYNASAAVWFVVASSGAPFLPRGFCFGYDQITAPVNIASSTEATGTVIITCAAHTFDGAPVLAQFHSPVVVGSTSASSLTISLFEGSTQIGRLGVMGESTAQVYMPEKNELVFTPSAGAHTYKVTAIASLLAGPPSVDAGSGGTGGYDPAFIRFTKF